MNKTTIQLEDKSSEQLIDEARSVDAKTASVYVPLICNALQIENPKFTLSEIQSEVIRQCDFWKKSTIKHYWGDFARSYEKSGKYKGQGKAKKTEQKKEIENTFNKIPEPDTTPYEPKYTPVETEEDDEETDKDLHSYGMGKIGDSGKSLREVLGDVNEHCAGLFKALSGKEIPHATEKEDMLVDYIKPTREYWKSYIVEADDMQRRRIHNWLSVVVELAEDRLELLKKVE